MLLVQDKHVVRASRKLTILIVFSLLFGILQLSEASDIKWGKKQQFFEVKDKRYYFKVGLNKKGKEVVEVNGLVIRPDFKTELKDSEAEGIYGYPSPDNNRIIVRIGHINNKNIWVINLNTKTQEYYSNENHGRHVFIKWLSGSSFELMFGGMGYADAYTYKFVNNKWVLISKKDVYGE